MDLRQMVEKFQCPGCGIGGPETCEGYIYSERYVRCTRHRLGTIIPLAGHIALGLPNGFNRPGPVFDGLVQLASSSRMSVRLYLEGTQPGWDEYNLPIWALEKDGFLFVRTYAPRINATWSDVIEKGTLALVPSAINVEGMNLSGQADI